MAKIRLQSDISIGIVFHVGKNQYFLETYVYIFFVFRIDIWMKMDESFTPQKI